MKIKQDMKYSAALSERMQNTPLEKLGVEAAMVHLYQDAKGEFYLAESTERREKTNELFKCVALTCVHLVKFFEDNEIPLNHGNSKGFAESKSRVAYVFIKDPAHDELLWQGHKSIGCTDELELLYIHGAKVLVKELPIIPDPYLLEGVMPENRADLN